MGLKKFRNLYKKFLQLKKPAIIKGENVTTIFAFLKYLSQIYLSLILAALEKVPMCGNLKYTFLLLLIVFPLFLVVY